MVYLFLQKTVHGPGAAAGSVWKKAKGVNCNQIWICIFEEEFKTREVRAFFHKAEYPAD